MTGCDAWFGPLPGHWSTARLKHHFSIALGKMLNASNEVAEDSVVAPYVTAGSIQPDSLVIDESRTMAFSSAELDQYSLRTQDVLVVEGGAGYGRSHHLDCDMPGWGFQNHVARLRASTGGVQPKYLTYSLKACLASGYIEANNRTATMPSLSRDVLGSIAVPRPPLDEQQQIVDYLDRETARIEDLVARQQALIEISRERRLALGHRYFGSRHGKRPTSIRRVLAPLNRPTVEGLGVVTAYRDGVVTLRSNRRDEGYTFSDSEHGYQEVRPGDLVFHALDGFAGAVGISDSHGVCTPVYHVCRVISDDLPEYVAMLLRHLGTSGFLSAQAPNVRERSVDFRNWQTFARVPLELASPDEQRAVVADLVARTVEIEILIAKAERFVELANERRRALIAAAVTGQIDVAAAA